MTINRAHDPIAGPLGSRSDTLDACSTNSSENDDRSSDADIGIKLEDVFVEHADTA